MRSFDVIIIGRGMTGLSTARHLKSYGIKSVCIIGPNRDFTNCSSLNAGYASCSLHDNISRIVHGHGDEAASELLGLIRRGFSGLMTEASRFDTPVTEGQVFRLTESVMEEREMLIATSWLSAHGFPAATNKTRTSSRTLTFQSDGAASASIDVRHLMDHMESDIEFTIRSDQVLGVTPHPGHIEVRTQTGGKILSQIVVVAGHVGIKALIPKLESCLVNHADQWAEFEFRGKHPALTPGSLVFADFGQYWLSVTSNQKIRAGGARYLRKWAGVEADHAWLEERITDSIRNRIADLFRVELSAASQQHALLDLRACDEIPIIGPMFDDSRVLVSGGYMGSGLTLGYAAGAGLADFIGKGTSKSVPEIFHPKRLRSLPNVP